MISNDQGNSKESSINHRHSSRNAAGTPGSARAPRTPRGFAPLAKRIAVAAMCGLLLAQPLPPALGGGTKTALAAAAAGTAVAAQPTVTLASEDAISYGVFMRKYVWNAMRGDQAVTSNANIVVVDLQNPYVKLDTMTGVGGKLTTKQTVLGMAKDTGAIAGVNGDFYNTQADGAPIGPEISNGQLVSSPSDLPGYYAFAVTKDNMPIIDRFTFQGMLTTADGAVFPLSGVNKTYYWYEDGPNKGQHSMIDNVYLYTDAWGSENRANDGSTYPTEVLVENGIIKDIENTVIHQTPPKDGYILRSHGKATEFIFAHMKVGDPLKADYAIVPMDPQSIYDVKNFKTMIGGYTIMVDGGQAVNFSREVASIGGYRARTGLGYSQDGRYAFLITVDNNGDSKGMSLHEFQTFMASVGVWKGIDLDGGGSTQMVARPLGEFAPKLADQTEYDTVRRIVNGVGVYTSAPPSELLGLRINASQALLMNEKSTYTLKAYDKFYNPMVTDGLSVNWSVPKGAGSFQGNIFTPNKIGTTTITASVGSISQTMQVEVIGHEQIASMVINAPSIVFTDGTPNKVSVTVKTDKGITKTIPTESVKWTFNGFKGSVTGNMLTVDPKSIKKGISGQLIASYDGYSAIASVTFGEQKLWTNFSNFAYPVSFNAVPTDAIGDASIVTGLPGLDDTNRVLYLTYDLRNGTGTKAAYAKLGDTGAPIEGKPSQMLLKVMGDESLNYLRAEVLDANGNIQRIDIAKQVDWAGWKTITIDLDKSMAYPLTLTRLYIANPEQGQDERALIGQVAFDDITLKYPGQKTPVVNNVVKLTLNKKTITVNNIKQQIEQPPLIRNNYTLLPIRFVVDAMGGEVVWDGTERKVTIRRGDHLLQMWLDNPQINVDGVRKTSEVAPALINGRTMVPLRFISENMGWDVGWDPKTLGITLK